MEPDDKPDDDSDTLGAPELAYRGTESVLVPFKALETLPFELIELIADVGTGMVMSSPVGTSV